MNDAEVSIKFKNQVTGEKKLEKYSQTLSHINSILSGMDMGMARQLSQSAGTTKNISNDVSEMSKKVNIAFNYSLISKFVGAIKKLGSAFATLSKKSFDFLENFNLFQVAFQGNYNSAERFINKMSEMYGLDESWLTQTIGKFKQLTNAMNLSAETGEKVSELLTQMSLDISSLYNIDIDRAAATLSSAMAGQTKPIRGATGADITQTTLQTTLDKLGIDNTVNKLSFAEKRLLIIISLTQQLNGSIGDMARTIESPSNQLRIMNEQWERLTRAVGNVFLPILSKILPYLNAILMVLTEIISAIATLFGYKKEDFDYFDSASTGAWDLDEGLQSAGASAKKLKQGLRGFDKLNVITTPSAGGGGGGISGGLDPKLMNAFNEAFENYQKKLSDVQMKATKIRDNIMEWLGFTKQIDEETGEVSFKFDHITGGTVLGALAVGGVIFKGISIIGSIFTNWTGLSFPSIMGLFGEGGLIAKGAGLIGKIGTTISSINPIVAIIVAAVAALVGTFIHLYKTNEEFREKVDKFAAKIKQDIKPMVEGFLDTCRKIIKEVKPIAEKIYKDILKPLGNLLVSVLKPVIEVILDILEKLWDNVIVPLQPILKWIVDTAVEKLSNWLQKIGDRLELLISALQFLWDVVLGPLVEFIKDKIINKIDKVTKPIKEILGLIGDFKDDWEDLKSKFKLPELKIPKFPKIKLKVEFDTNVGTIKTAVYKALGLSGWPKLKFESYALGGLPQVGQMFIANEKGPELVGQIGGQSFVANQNQIGDFLEQKLGSVQSGNSTQVYNIYLDKNTKLATYVINQLQDMAKTNGKPIEIGG